MLIRSAIHNRICIIHNLLFDMRACPPVKHTANFGNGTILYAARLFCVFSGGGGEEGILSY